MLWPIQRLIMLCVDIYVLVTGPCEGGHNAIQQMIVLLIFQSDNIHTWHNTVFNNLGSTVGSPIFPSS